MHEPPETVAPHAVGKFRPQGLEDTGTDSVNFATNEQNFVQLNVEE
jgi:hypothetical protein